MTREQCEHCKRHSYGRDGRCYAARKTGVSASAISYCCKGIRERALGLSFSFDE